MSVFRARQAAERLLTSLGVRRAPVDVGNVATRLGLRVLRQELGDDISGLLVRTATGTQICVAAKHPEVRRRFTIAHEIAHHVLGHQFEPGEHVHVDRGNYISQRGVRASEGVDPKEIEANQFAACLLMPTDLVRAAVERLGEGPLLDGHVEELARKFKVSEQAMTIRLTTLGAL
jgi:Zn-dependent peptidase ImmA (M78 family)